MSQKEINFIILDVGSSMYKMYKDDKSRLESSIDSIILLLQQKLFLSPQHEVLYSSQIGILLMGADENEQHMIYIQEIGQPNTQLIRDVESLNLHDQPETQGGDIFKALDTSLELLSQYSKEKKQPKRIFCITNGSGRTQCNRNEIDEICIKMIDNNAKVNFQSQVQVIGVDFLNNNKQNNDNKMEIEEIYEENAQQQDSQELNKTPEQFQQTNDSNNENNEDIQKQNQDYLKAIEQNLGDDYIKIHNIQETIDMYSHLRSKSIPQRCKFKSDLELTSNLKIKVNFYGKTVVNSLPSLKNYIQSENQSNLAKEGQIIQKKKYTIDDEIVDKEDLIRGYHYGKQLVSVPEILQQEIKCESEKCLKILGFAHMSQVPRESFMSGVDMLMPPENETDQVAFNSLAIAMQQKSMYGIVRYVFRNQTAPKLACIIPYIDKEIICFWLVILPTVEDIRDFQFNSLKETTSEQDQVNLMTQAVSELIDQMDLAPVVQESDQTFQKELLKPKNLFNPINQNCYQQLIHRALNEDEELQPLDPTIEEYLCPEQKIYVKSSKQIKKVKSLFKLKENYIKNKKKKIFWQDVIRNNEQNEQLVKNHLPDDDIKKNIGDKDPIKDFKQMINEKREDLVDSAILQMQKIIMSYVNRSNEQNNFYENSLQCLIQLRKACIREDEPQAFNEFLYTIREFTGNNIDYWKLVINSGVSLIMECECSGGVQTDESIKFTEGFYDQNLDLNIKPENHIE